YRILQNLDAGADVATAREFEGDFYRELAVTWIETQRLFIRIDRFIRVAVVLGDDSIDERSERVGLQLVLFFQKKIGRGLLRVRRNHVGLLDAGVSRRRLVQRRGDGRQGSAEDHLHDATLPLAIPVQESVPR